MIVGMIIGLTIIGMIIGLTINPSTSFIDRQNLLFWDSALKQKHEESSIYIPIFSKGLDNRIRKN